MQVTLPDLNLILWICSSKWKKVFYYKILSNIHLTGNYKYEAFTTDKDSGNGNIDRVTQ